MALPYAGINRQLKDANTPWPKKVALARYAWVSPRCFLPNKEQVLIDWAANSLTNASKFNIPEGTISILWQFLRDALRSKRLERMGGRIESLSLRPGLFKVILQSLRVGCPYVEAAVASCHALMGYASLGSLITGKMDNQVEFLASVMSLLGSFLTAVDGPIHGELAALVMKSFSSFAVLQRQQPNPRKVLVVVYEKLLEPALLLLNTIRNTAGPKNFDLEGVAKGVEELIVAGLFNRDLVEGHVKYLRSAPGVAVTEKQREVRLLQESITALWDNVAEKVGREREPDLSSAYIAGLPVILDAFTSSHKYPSDIVFAMFCELVCIMGLAADRCDEDEDRPSTGEEVEPEVQNRMRRHGDWKSCLPALRKMLEIVEEKRIYEVASDNLTGKRHFNWLHRLSKDIITNADRSTPDWYASLNVLLRMNHLLLEDDLMTVVKEALCSSHRGSPTLPERDCLLDALLGTYARLRQFDRVACAVIETCRTLEPAAVSFTFQAHFSESFSASVQSLPPGLTFDIWSQLLTELRTHYLHHDIPAPPSSSPPPRKKHRPRRSLPGMAAAAATFVLFLRSVRLVDSTGTVPFMRRAGDLMRETKEGLLEPLFNSCRESKPSASQLHSTLLLCHIWGEVHLLLCQHCSCGYRAVITVPDRTLTFGDFSSVHPYVMPEEWSALWTVLDDETAVTELKLSLAVQQARALLVHCDVEATNVHDSLVGISAEICKQATSSSEVAGPHNLAVVLAHLPLLLPYLTSEGIANLAGHLTNVVSSLGSEASLPDRQPSEGADASLHALCVEFIGGAACAESGCLQTALTTSVLGQLSEVMSGVRPSTCAVLRDLSLASDRLDAETVAELWSRATMGCDQELAGSRGRVSAEFYQSVDGLLQVVSLLPLPHLLPSNKARCILGLLAVDRALVRTSSGGAEYQSTLLVCRQLEAALLRGVAKGELSDRMIAVGVLSETTRTSVGRDEKIVPITDDDRLNDVTGDLIAHWMRRVRRLTNQEAAFREYYLMVAAKLTSLTSSLTIQNLAPDTLPLLRVASELLSSLLASRRLLDALKDDVGGGATMTTTVEDTLSELLRCITPGVASAAAAPRALCHLARLGNVLVRLQLRSAGTVATVGEETVGRERWRDVFAPLLQEICRFFSSVSPTGDVDDDYVIASCLAYMRATCLMVGRGYCCDTHEAVTSDVWRTVLSLAGSRDCWDESLMNDYQKTLSRLIKTLSLARFQALLRNLLGDMELNNDDLRLRGAVVAWQLLPGCFETKDVRSALSNVIPKVISNLLKILEGAVGEWPLGGALVLSSLRAVRSIVEQGESIVKADDAMYAQHFCLMVPVAKATRADFPLVFNVLCQILRSLLIGYPGHVMSSLASYLACLQHLLNGVMRWGQLDLKERLGEHDIYMCAESIERLLTLLATYKDDVSKLAVFLVAEYIAGLQRGALQPLFKKTLVPGVYNLLDACDERAVDFLNASLPNNLRELFKTFHSDFQMYYKYMGRV